jgi:putative SOS response-associated peptidase YedK
MCGRITLTTPAEVVAELFELAGPVALKARYNIAPSQLIPTVRVDERSGARQLCEIRWGLIPSWAADPAIGNRMINARAESLADRSAFREALQKRRCLVVVDGFYEWRGTSKSKQPYLIRARGGAPFALAGLWEVWHDAEGRRIESGTIVTTAANAAMRPIHDRMPVIIPRASYALWMDPGITDPASLAGLLAGTEEPPLETTPVTTHVNDPRNDDPRCIEAEPLLF